MEIRSMQNQKSIICPGRIRRIPRQFSWVDQRLVRDRYMERCSPEALALYLFSVTVSDCEGLSYYSNRTISRILSLSEAEVDAARKRLHQAKLIAYRRPVIQVLSLEAQHG